MTDRLLKLAWAAGFLDGEAYIGVVKDRNTLYRKSRFYRVQVSVGQVKRLPLDSLQAIFGGTVYKAKDRFGFHYTWSVSGKRTTDMLNLLLPFLVAKREQALLCVEFNTTVTDKYDTGFIRKFGIPKDVQIRRESLYLACKALNVRRHAERLNEEAPTAEAEDGAIVRTASNKEDAEVAEMTTRLAVVR